jgi:hypothetical protein
MGKEAVACSSQTHFQQLPAENKKFCQDNQKVENLTRALHKKKQGCQPLSFDAANLFSSTLKLSEISGFMSCESVCCGEAEELHQS